MKPYFNWGHLNKLYLMQGKIEKETEKYLFTYDKSYLGTIQILRYHVFDFFRPTHPPLS